MTRLPCPVSGCCGYLPCPRHIDYFLEVLEKVKRERKR